MVCQDIADLPASGSSTLAGPRPASTSIQDSFFVPPRAWNLDPAAHHEVIVPEENPRRRKCDPVDSLSFDRALPNQTPLLDRLSSEASARAAPSMRTPPVDSNGGDGRGSLPSHSRFYLPRVDSEVCVRRQNWCIPSQSHNQGVHRLAEAVHTKSRPPFFQQQ